MDKAKQQSWLSEDQVDGLRAQAQGSLLLGNGSVVVPGHVLLALLDENEDLRAEVEAVGEGYCECGRPAEFCFECLCEER